MVENHSGVTAIEIVKICIHVNTERSEIIYTIGNLQNRGLMKLEYLKSFSAFSILFDLILYIPSTIFQLLRDGSSWFEQVLS